MADNTVLIAGPYTPPKPDRGCVYDAMRHRRGKVGGYHETTFGPWAAYGGDRQTRPIVCEELRRAIESESASAVAHHWRVNISTVVRWRAKLMADPRNEVPGTTSLLSAIAHEVGSTPEMAVHLRDLTAAYTPEEDDIIRAGGIPPGRSEHGVSVRRSRLGIAGPTGRPPSEVAERYGCWRVTGEAGAKPNGERLYSAECEVCGSTRITTANKLRRSATCVRCASCPK